MKKHIIPLCSISAIALFLLFLVLHNNMAWSHKIMAEKYSACANEITQISDFLETVDDNSATIQIVDGTAMLSLFDELPVKEVAINDETLLNAITAVFEMKCEIIIKQEGCIYYQFYSNLDNGGGILYLCNDGKPPEKDSSGITIASDLIVGQIYCYETDL